MDNCGENQPNEWIIGVKVRNTFKMHCKMKKKTNMLTSKERSDICSYCCCCRCYRYYITATSSNNSNDNYSNDKKDNYFSAFAL